MGEIDEVERGLVLRELIKQAISIVLLYFLIKYWWSGQQWAQDKIKELLFFLGVGVLFFVISLFTSIFARPITVSIHQSNKSYGTKETNYSISGNRKTQQHERIVDLNLKVMRKYSIWGRLVAKLLKNKNIVVLVEPVTQGIVLQAKKEDQRTDLQTTPTGFQIKLGEYLERILSRSEQGEYSKGCEYLVVEDTLHPVTNETFQVVPILTVGGKPAPSWVNLILKFSADNHCIRFIKG